MTTRRAKKASARPRNYRSRSTATTLQRQADIRELLAFVGEGLSVAEIGRALGVSRQLALYHVKKLVAAGGCAALLVPCASNGGLQFIVWDEAALTTHYARLATVRAGHSDIRELGRAA